MDDLSPFLLPAPGRPYKEVWAEEDKSLMPAGGTDAASKSSPQQSQQRQKQKKQKLSNIFFEDFGLLEDNFCLPFTERIVATLFENESTNNLLSTDGIAANAANGNGGPNNNTSNNNTDLSPVEDPATVCKSLLKEQSKDELFSVEERIKSELKYVGLLDDGDMLTTNTASQSSNDDEVSVELRRLQADLRRLIELNNGRKRRVREVLLDHLAYQEYRMVLNELNRQIISSYQKRFVSYI